MGSEHHGIALARQMEGLIEALIEQGWKIGSVITDNAGQCARARRILAIRWPTIHFGKCFAHDINNLAKAILSRTDFRDVAVKACAAVNALNGSSSKWLPRANKSTMETYDLLKPLAFLSLCYTRYNSMQACFASLLRVKTGLKQFATRYQFDNDVPASVLVFLDESFWCSLSDAEMTIRPLCSASYILQRDSTSLADVVTCFRDIFDSFVIRPRALERIPLVEERWEDCEQPLLCWHYFFTLGTSSKQKHYLTKVSPQLMQCATLECLSLKVFFLNENGMLRHQLFKWCQSELYIGLEYIRYDEFPTVEDFWVYAKGKEAGSNLPDLALAILSIAANTATCERYFSVFGLIHTPVQNCMKSAKANKASIASQAIRERDRPEDAVPSFGRNQDVNDDKDVVEEDCDGNKYASRIINPAERSFRDDSWRSNTTPRQAAARTATRPRDLTPSMLIHYPASPSFPARSPENLGFPPSTPIRSNSSSRRPPTVPSRSYSRRSHNVGDHVSRTPNSSSRFRTLDFSDEAVTQSDGYYDVQHDITLSEQPEENDVGASSGARARDLLSHWLDVFVLISDGSIDSDPDINIHEPDVNEEIDDGGHLRRQAIPEWNDTNFPQEAKKLSGYRGKKTLLVELFYIPNTLYSRCEDT